MNKRAVVHELTFHLPADISTVIPPNMTDVKLEQGPMW